jgi:hypothetical protein
LAKSPKSHLLEELRAKAESVSAKRVEQQQLSREVVERVDRRLHSTLPQARWTPKRSMIWSI